MYSLPLPLNIQIYIPCAYILFAILFIKQVCHLPSVAKGQSTHLVWLHYLQLCIYNKLDRQHSCENGVRDIVTNSNCQD